MTRQNPTDCRYPTRPAVFEHNSAVTTVLAGQSIGYSHFWRLKRLLACASPALRGRGAFFARQRPILACRALSPLSHKF